MLGREVGRRLRALYDVVHHDWTDTRRIAPSRDDVLLGHPHPAPWTIFRRSMRLSGWSRVLALAPFNHDPRQVAFLDPVLRRVDLYLAITGRHWVDTIAASDVAHFAPKLVSLDLAINSDDFPLVKTSFNPPGRRRFLYVGHSGWTKNPRYLTAIARELPDIEFSWIGTGNDAIRGFAPLGWQDFSTSAARELVARHDFLLTVSRADANPMTVLEAMAWGLVPVCTRESGYAGVRGIVNVPLDDAEAAAAILRGLAEAPDDELVALQRANRRAVETYYTWDRFAATIIDAIESDVRQPVGPERVGRRVSLAAAAIASPYSPLAPNNLRLLARRAAPRKLPR